MENLESDHQTSQNSPPEFVYNFSEIDTILIRKITKELEVLDAALDACEILNLEDKTMSSEFSTQLASILARYLQLPELPYHLDSPTTAIEAIFAAQEKVMSVVPIIRQKKF